MFNKLVFCLKSDTRSPLTTTGSIIGVFYFLSFFITFLLLFREKRHMVFKIFKSVQKCFYRKSVNYGKVQKAAEEIYAFFISNTIISNARPKLTKNQLEAKQHTEAELLLFETYSLSSSTLSSKNNRRHPKNVQKTSTSISISLYD